jgi:hypothetical protein
MVQMRWYKTNSSKTLQYRVKYNATIYAGMPTEEQKLKTANYQWSEWMNVPEVWDVDAEEK